MFAFIKKHLKKDELLLTDYETSLEILFKKLTSHQHILKQV